MVKAKGIKGINSKNINSLSDLFSILFAFCLLLFLYPYLELISMLSPYEASFKPAYNYKNIQQKIIQ